MSCHYKFSLKKTYVIVVDDDFRQSDYLYSSNIKREREGIKEQQNDASGKSNIHTSNRIPTSGKTCFTYLI